MHSILVHPDTDLKIERLQLRAQSVTFENGSINWQVCTNDECLLFGGTLYIPIDVALCFLFTFFKFSFFYI